MPNKPEPLSRVLLLWSLLAALLHGYWVVTNGAPLGTADTDAANMGNWLTDVSPRPASAVLTAISLGAMAAAAQVLSRRPVIDHRIVGAVLFALAIPFLLVADVRLLQTAAYGLHGYFGLVDATVLHQVFCLATGVLLGCTGLAVLRRPDRSINWIRIGRWATVVAALAPMPYAIQRALWNLGVPLGVSEEFIRGLAADLDAKNVSPILAYSLSWSAVLGSLLTLGLVMRWGEILPAWVPGLGGRRVPVLLAVIPGITMSVVITIAGLAIIRFAVKDALTDGLDGAVVPGLLWLPWGLALGLATVAYWRRRQQAGEGKPRRALVTV